MPVDLPPSRRRRLPLVDLDHPIVVSEVRRMFWVGFALGLGSWAALTAVLLWMKD